MRSVAIVLFGAAVAAAIALVWFLRYSAAFCVFEVHRHSPVSRNFVLEMHIGNCVRMLLPEHSASFNEPISFRRHRHRRY